MITLEKIRFTCDHPVRKSLFPKTIENDKPLSEVLIIAMSRICLLRAGAAGVLAVTSDGYVNSKLKGNFYMRTVLAIIACLLLVAGCGNDEESIAKKTGNKVGEALTEFASGMGKGIDKKMEVKTELSKILTDSGISSTVSKLDALGKKSLSVYLIAAKAYKGKLMAKAVNAKNQEIGRATADVDLAANDAGYTIFEFHQETDTQTVTKYLIDAVR